MANKNYRKLYLKIPTSTESDEGKDLAIQALHKLIEALPTDPLEIGYVLAMASAELCDQHYEDGSEIWADILEDAAYQIFGPPENVVGGTDPKTMN